MSRPNTVHSGGDVDSASEDDLDLDELDPATTASLNGYPQNPSEESKRRLRGKTPGNIPLQRLQKYGGSRGLWRSKGRQQKGESAVDEEDTEALLNSWPGHSHGGNGHIRRWSEERAGWNVRNKGGQNSIGGQNVASQQARETPSRRPSQSMQFQEFVRQELADMRDNKDVDNADNRDIQVGQSQKRRFPTNVVSNAKYTAWSFLPRTLYNEFSFFLNIYFLLVALSQIIPYLRIGYMSTYIVPLACVLTITIGKEAIDDIARRRRDAEANSELFTALSFPAAARPRQQGVVEVQKRSRDIKVGDVLKLEKNQRFPADVVILQSHLTELLSELTIASASDTGETFIRTDQLDGETDWKLRLPSPLSQNLRLSELQRLQITAGAPDKQVNHFVGTLGLRSNHGSAYDPHLSKPDPGHDAPDTGNQDEPHANRSSSAPLTIDNTAWANTVLASSTTTYCVVVYTGRQTRSALSTSPSRSKTGLLELEINNLTKILCIMTLTLSITLVALEGFEPSNKKPWYVAIMIYLILFSTIIPISLRVNLDLGKSVYANMIEHDKGIPDTVVRTSTIPEDLGRIEYLLSDKTGTLTQNEMLLKKIHVGTVAYSGDAMEEVAAYIDQAFSSTDDTHSQGATTTKTRREIGVRVRDLILALALCHNVTPTTDEVNGERVVSYQASSPDEIAIVEFTESVGLRLLHRDRENIVLQSVKSDRIVLRAEIKDIFPFTSDSKRMGIIVQLSSEIPGITNMAGDEVWFFQKGADTVMSNIVAANDWLDEETANMAREGLRTLVVGRKRLSPSQYADFSSAYTDASLALHERDAGMASVVQTHLEHDLELLGVTGVEDRLQKDVKPSLELLRNAGVKIWMLTGDKIETARCVAVSARLVARGQHIQTMARLKTKAQAKDALDLMRNQAESCLLIDGESLALVLAQFRMDFITIAVQLPAVIACRCSPTQKAEVAHLIRKHTKKRVCCIGDGGNDVSMIQAADVGIGIVGKEGRQASLAADFSITQFCHLTKLLVWHGRNSYKRSAKLAQFIIHRGLIISVCQTMYNIAGHFDPKGLFKDWLLVGYATVYTMAPVFSLVLDRDVDEQLANLYPELYKELKSGKSLSYQTFFTWVLVSVYQGIIIQGLTQLLVGEVDGPRMLSVSFTVLVLNELIMVAVAVTTWHPIMIICILGTAALYAASVPFLGGYFDLAYVASWSWVWRVVAVGAISLVPVWGGKAIRRMWKPPNYRKVQGI
ncbi:putative aminophospholipid-translocase [Exophiala xenobiotica]|uniref:Phospholipid-transporting ATPase n=1 Tax=Vermiconidia calcicola TaxID=1690605 RepID=A0AAV9QPL8_9PEZI|nr:putative aminophospholipid-translocase [Exophiala xenobiotica]KAK5545954.1 putative aminophospholipid-translocase [Vermiconidia calcicola]KAK5549789.1 putative aminophospholipid-translocase [Chaetothyriales sp. CCFEE 6169]KAK5308415.1 putative aminophospholipid-translocase [Exophiala xenobiotica]KAK5342690.1 putative aminophospholipid-translocase [Exophiala xenobiotica]